MIKTIDYPADLLSKPVFRSIASMEMKIILIEKEGGRWVPTFYLKKMKTVRVSPILEEGTWNLQFITSELKVNSLSGRWMRMRMRGGHQ